MICHSLLGNRATRIPCVVGANSYGHDHNGVEPYKEGCNHINLAANVCGYTPLNLGKL